jgi:choline dehydrogenase
MEDRQDTADFIIAGAGSAGCVLAHRLSEDAQTTVALLEAGGRKLPHAVKVPLFFNQVSANPSLNWNFTAEPEPHAGGRTLSIKRGRVIGGSSSINGLSFTRGHPADYDNWGSLAPGWSHKDVLPYFKRLERSWRGDTETHGATGPMPVSRYPVDRVLHQKIAAAAQTRGHRLNDDFDGEGAEGFGCYDTTTHNGRRASAATHYLLPALGRPNLRLETEALVTRILFEGRRAVGVEYRRDGEVLQMFARREVIIAGGSYNSPQLLMLSGVGPGGHLADHGVTVLHDLPAVGQNLQEQPVIVSMFNCREFSEFDKDMRLDRLAWSMLRWQLFGAGLLAATPIGAVGFFRSTLDKLQPDIEAAFVTSSPLARPWLPLVRPARGKTIWCCIWNLRPESRGHVWLKSADASVGPAILHNLLATPGDVEILRAALREIRELAATAPLSSWISDETAPGPDANTDEELEAYIRSTAVAGAHPTSTCAMGADDRAVTKPDLTVRGVDGLRVIDASVMPQMVSAHTNAATLMIAERGADLVRGRAAA